MALHAAWLLGLWYFAVHRAPAGQDVSLFWLGLFVVLQWRAVWVIASLGGRWTTRIIVAAGRAAGAARALSLRVASQLLGGGGRDPRPAAGLRPASGTALVFSALNAAMMWIRIRAEAAALKPQ